MNNVTYLVVISGRKQKDALVSILLEMGGRGINVIYGKGSVKANYLKDMLGLVSEVDKVMLSCLFPHEKTNALFDILVEKHYFDKPNTGIAFTIPIEALSF